VDITAHEMESTRGDLHEIFKATGGPHGSVGLSVSLSVCLSTGFVVASYVCVYGVVSTKYCVSTVRVLTRSAMRWCYLSRYSFGIFLVCSY